MNLRHNILAIDDDGLALGRAQSDVEDGALFRDVDFVAAEHGVDARAQAGLLGQLQQERERFAGDAMLRIIEIDADGLDGHSLAARSVVSEEFSEMQLADLRVVGFERFPSRA